MDDDVPGPSAVPIGTPQPSNVTSSIWLYEWDDAPIAPDAVRSASAVAPDTDDGIATALRRLQRPASLRVDISSRAQGCRRSSAVGRAIELACSGIAHEAQASISAVSERRHAR